MKSFVRALKYSFLILYRSSKLLIVIYLMLQLVCAMLPLFSTYLMRNILNYLTISKTGSVVTYVFVYIVTLAFLQICLSAMNVCYDTCLSKADLQYTTDLNERLTHCPLSFIDTSEGKNLVDEVRHLKFAVINFPNFIVQTITFLSAFIVAFSAIAAFHFGFAVLFIVLTIPGILFQFHFRIKADILRRKTAPDVRKFSYYRWLLTDAWPAKDVRTYDLTDPIKARYDEEKDVYRTANKMLDKRRTAMAILSEIIMRSGEIVFSVFAIIQALLGKIAIGDMAMYISFALSVTTSFQNMMGTILFGVVRSVQNMKYVFAFQEYEYTKDTGEKRKLNTFESLSFDNVYFKYPKTDKYILSGASFTLNRGDKLSLVGINGSGKSTIIKLMLGLYEIESGRILINDHPMSDYDIRDVRKLFSALFQNFVQYPLTLRENIALSDLNAKDNDNGIKTALIQSGVYDELQPKLENGLDSYMTRQFDDKGTELSRGQWQKVALSRAYFKNAPIVIFDEPSAALDAEAEDRIFRNFEEIAEGKTGIMISHRISAARMSNKIIVLDGGRIIEQGMHDELVAMNGFYAKLYNIQKEKYTVKEGQ